MLAAVSDWSQWDHLLGTMPDAALAAQIGVSNGVVVQRRYKLGIPAFEPHGYVDWSRWDDLLGTLPDSDLAQRIGCSKTMVQMRRIRLHITAYLEAPWTEDDERLLGQGQAKCVRCGEVKEVAAFPGDRNKRTGTKRACRECVNGATKRYADDNKRHWIEQMGGVCQHCGESRFISALDFHHVNGDGKDANPSLLIARRKRWDRALEELDKCCLLCSNCHRALHGGELSLNFVKREGLGWTIERSVTS